MPAIPIAVWIALAVLASGVASPFLVKAYHRLHNYIKAKTGVDLPDDPAIDSQIVCVVKALAPLLVRDFADGRITPAEALELLNAVKNCVGSKATATVVNTSVAHAINEMFDPTSSNR